MVRLAKPLPGPRLFFYRTPTGILYAVCLCNMKTRVKDDGTLQMHSNGTGRWCFYSGAPVSELPQENPALGPG